MAFVISQQIQQGLESAPSVCNAIRTAPQVVIMVPTSSAVKPRVQYEEKFPKKVVICLSSVQLCMAFLAIITQIILHSVSSPGVAYVGAGIWCGILYGLSGLFGILAARKPSN